MGEIREEVQSFYMRDYVEEKVVVVEHFYQFLLFHDQQPLTQWCSAGGDEAHRAAQPL